MAAILDGKHIYISFITEIELYSFKSLNTSDKKSIGELLDSCTIIDLNAGIKEQTIEVRQKFNLKIPDSFIAATAVYFGMPLLSADKEFKKVSTLDLLSYEK